MVQIIWELRNFQKRNPYTIYAFMNLDAPKREIFDDVLYESIEYDYYDMFYETLVKLSLYQVF